MTRPARPSTRPSVDRRRAGAVGLAALALAVAGLAVPGSAAATTSGLSCAPDPWESDTSTTAAAPIAVGETLTRAICQAPNPFPRTEAGVDGDYFVFTASGTTAYTAEVVAAGDQLAGLGIGVARLEADGRTTSVEQDSARSGLRAITDVLPAGRYVLYVASGATQVYPDNTMDIKTIQGPGGAYSVRLAATAPAPRVTSLTLSSSTVSGGKGLTGTYTLSAPAPSGGMYSFTSSSDLFVVYPEGTYVPAGATRVTFAISTKKISTTRTFTLSVRTGVGPAASATLTVKK